VGLLTLQRWRGSTRLAVTECGEAPVLSPKACEDVVAGRRVQEEDRRPPGSLAHGLRPLAVLGLGVVPRESVRTVGGPLILLGSAPQPWVPVMGCEGVYVDPVVTRMSSGERLANGGPVKATCPGPPSSSSVGGTDSGDI